MVDWWRFVAWQVQAFIMCPLGMVWPIFHSTCVGYEVHQPAIIVGYIADSARMCLSRYIKLGDDVPNVAQDLP